MFNGGLSFPRWTTWEATPSPSVESLASPHRHAREAAVRTRALRSNLRQTNNARQAEDLKAGGRRTGHSRRSDAKGQQTRRRTGHRTILSIEHILPLRHANCFLCRDIDRRVACAPVDETRAVSLRSARNDFRNGDSTRDRVAIAAAGHSVLRRTELRSDMHSFAMAPARRSEILEQDGRVSAQRPPPP